MLDSHIKQIEMVLFSVIQGKYGVLLVSFTTQNGSSPCLVE